MPFCRCYARVSTEEQALSGYSLEAQQDRLREAAAYHRWDIAGWYIDRGVSGKSLERPELQRLLADLKPGEILVVYKLDRLTRSVRDLDDLLRLFEQKDIHFHSTMESFDTTTPSGRLFLRIVAEIAQWERETISERSAEGKWKKAAEGEWNGGTPPYGYLAVPSGKTKNGKELMALVPDPLRAPTVVKVFDRYLSGHGIRGISMWLNTVAQVPTLKGSKWRSNQIIRILRNPVYCGYMTHKSKKGTVTAPGVHEPIIARETFDRVQAMFEIRKATAPRQATGQYPLSGVARCGVCGAAIYTHGDRRRKGKNTYYYECHNYISGYGCGPGKSLAYVPGPAIEAEVVEQISRLSQPERLQEFLEACGREFQAAQGMEVAERARLEQDIADTEAVMSRWVRAFEAGRIEVEEYLERIRPHKEKLAGLQGRLKDVKTKPEPPPAAEIQLVSGTFKEAWQLATPPERKALLQRFCQAFTARLYLFPDRRVEIRPAAVSGPGSRT